LCGLRLYADAEDEQLVKQLAQFFDDRIRKALGIGMDSVASHPFAFLYVDLIQLLEHCHFTCDLSSNDVEEPDHSSLYTLQWKLPEGHPLSEGCFDPINDLLECFSVDIFLARPVMSTTFRANANAFFGQLILHEFGVLDALEGGRVYLLHQNVLDHSPQPTDYLFVRQVVPLNGTKLVRDVDLTVELLAELFDFLSVHIPKEVHDWFFHLVNVAVVNLSWCFLERSVLAACGTRVVHLIS
jgi:hypothetical protein